MYPVDHSSSPLISHRQPVGSTLYFTHGQFLGQTIRSELFELQKADLARKYARVDRRPLDPPPVVVLRLSEIFDYGTPHQTEVLKSPDHVKIHGFLCTVDLFPISTAALTRVRGKAHSSSGASLTRPRFPSASAASPTQIHPPGSPPSSTPDSSWSPQSHPTLKGPLSLVFPAKDTPSPEYSQVVHYVDGHPVTEASKATDALVGSTFVQSTIIDWNGERMIVFVFADLAVKIEGTFILRYRVFDLFSKTDGPVNERRVQAECYGGPFRVYSTKDFPGLQASTELTKHISRYGIRLNIRGNERKHQKKRSSSPTDSGWGSAGSKRKFRDREMSEDSSEGD